MAHRGPESPANGFGSELPASAADARADLFGGRGTVLVWDLLGGAGAAPFTAVLACELAPGGSVGVHVQQRDAEIVVCLAGVGAAEVDGVPRAMLPGVVVHLPFGKSLALRNGSVTEPLRYLIVKATGAVATAGRPGGGATPST